MDFATVETLRNLAYLVAAVLFIFGIKGLTHPRTAVRGNLLGALGMLLAAVVTVIGAGFGATGWVLVVAGVVIGSVVGAVLAVRIQMTAMPQLVALFNGFGGIASLLVAGAVLHESLHELAGLREQVGRGRGGNDRHPQGHRGHRRLRPDRGRHLLRQRRWPSRSCRS